MGRQFRQAKELVINSSLHHSKATDKSREKTHTCRWNSHLCQTTAKQKKNNDFIKWKTSVYMLSNTVMSRIILWLSAASKQSAWLSCLVLIYHDLISPSTLQATQYFRRSCKEMSNIYYLRLWLSDPYENRNPGKVFMTALNCDTENDLLRFGHGFFFYIYIFWFSCSINANYFRS